MREDNASAGVSPARSEDRGRSYDRETIISFDMNHETDVVSEISRGTFLFVDLLNLRLSIRLAVVARAT